MASMVTDASPGLSREPSDWGESVHFGESYGDPLRFHTPEMVAETLLHGREEVSRWGAEWRLRKLEYDGVDCVVVLATDTPTLVTGWTEVRSYQRALSSERWSLAELEAIRAFEDREHKLRPSERADLSGN